MSNIEKPTITTTATWDISIYCECPNCDEYFDIIEHEHDFFQENNLETKTVETSCPRCMLEFTAKLEF